MPFEFLLLTIKIPDHTIPVWNLPIFYLHISYFLRNRIRPKPPACPVGIESDMIRCQIVSDSTFGRVRNRDMTKSRIRHDLTSCPRLWDMSPENRTRKRKKSAAGLALKPNFEFLFVICVVNRDLWMKNV